MNLSVILCLSLVLVVLLAAYISQFRANAFAQSHDALADAMLAITSSGPCWFLVWFVISGVLGVIVPFVAGRDLDWFDKQNGLLITTNYTFAVPVLVGAYMGLTRRIREFVEPNSLAILGIEWDAYRAGWLFKRRFWNACSKILLVVLTLVITWAANLAILGTEEKLSSPWAVSDTTLSVAGIIYYALRGVNAYLAMGLIFLAVGVFAVFVGKFTLNDPRTLLTKDLTVKPMVRQVTTALATCALFGALVTVMHGTALLYETSVVEPEASRLVLLIKSTWLYWAILAFVATFCLLFSVFWLYIRVDEGVKLVRQDMNDHIERLYGTAPGTLKDYAEKLEALTKVRTYMDLAGPAAMPKSDLLLVVGSVLVQAVNFGHAVIKTFSSTT